MLNIEEVIPVEYPQTAVWYGGLNGREIADKYPGYFAWDEDTQRLVRAGDGFLVRPNRWLVLDNAEYDYQELTSGSYTQNYKRR